MSFEGGLERGDRGFTPMCKGQSVPAVGGSDREGSRSEGEFCAWDLEAERVGGGAQRTGRVVCVKSRLKIDRSSVVHRFVTDGQCLVQNSFWDREPVQCLKQRGDVLAFAFSKNDACRFVLER